MIRDYNFSLGCHNLTGGSSYWRSERLVRCALELGIRRFDVAPSYGLGTAECTLARALGCRRSDEDIEITTKFGILPPRFAHLAAWVREPYRALRKISGLHAPAAPIPRGTGSRPAPLPASLDIMSAATSSLRVLQVERLGAFLIHERLEYAAVRVRDELSELLSQGLIAKTGCSGAIENVRDMLDLAGPAATVAQTSIFDWRALPPTLQRRFFNLGTLGRLLYAEQPRAASAAEALRDLKLDSIRRSGAGLFIAGAIAWAGQRFPDAVLIVNASTAERLRVIVEGARKRPIRDWARMFDMDVQMLIDRHATKTLFSAADQ